jgi:hypothetical protein
MDMDIEAEANGNVSNSWNASDRTAILEASGRTSSKGWERLVLEPDQLRVHLGGDHLPPGRVDWQRIERIYKNGGPELFENDECVRLTHSRDLRGFEAASPKAYSQDPAKDFFERMVVRTPLVKHFRRFPCTVSG